jgi:hypothetical protein
MLSNVQRVIIWQHTAGKMNSGGFLKEKERSLETFGERVSLIFSLWGITFGSQQQSNTVYRIPEEENNRRKKPD